jgi:hypothetical protein
MRQTFTPKNANDTQDTEEHPSIWSIIRSAGVVVSTCSVFAQHSIKYPSNERADRSMKLQVGGSAELTGRSNALFWNFHSFVRFGG